jgi:hypothetical protein
MRSCKKGVNLTSRVVDQQLRDSRLGSVQSSLQPAKHAQLILTQQEVLQSDTMQIAPQRILEYFYLT